MRISPVSITGQRSNHNVGFEKKENKSDRATYPKSSSNLNTAKALALAALLSIPGGAYAQANKTSAAGPNAQVELASSRTETSAKSTYIAENKAVNETKAAPEIVSEKDILSSNYEVVTVKTINNRAPAGKFDEIRIKVGNDPEGKLFGFDGRFDDKLLVEIKSDKYSDGRDVKRYGDPKIRTYIEELRRSNGNARYAKPYPGTIPTESLDITVVPKYASYVQKASRQFSDEEGNKFLVNHYNSKGDAKDGFDKVLLFVLAADNASCTEVSAVSKANETVYVKREDGKTLRLPNSEIVSYLLQVGNKGNDNLPSAFADYSNSIFE